jgi:phosphatidylglycerol---prolipoprotein diacylglyceryl transferase
MPLVINIDVDPNIAQLGPFLITWHGVFAVLGILAAARLGVWLAEKDGIDTAKMWDGVVWMVVIGLVGARLLYFWENYRLFEGQYYRVFLINEGGISQWGGLFGAMLGGFIWTQRTKISFWGLFDAAGAAAMIGLTIGRIGDVINGEHKGTPSNVPWAVDYVNEHTLGQRNVPVHLEVGYEMVLCLGLLAIILPFHQRLKKRLPAGVLGLTYFGLYGIGRFFLSFLRLDPAVFLGLRQAQLASALMALIAVVAIPVLLMLARRGRLASASEPSREPQARA